MSASSVAEKTVSSSRSRREDAGGSLPLVEISNAIVGLYKEAFGRGPTKTRTQFAGSDTVVVLLEDALTPAERTLLAVGETGRLREARLVVQEALEMEVRSVIERALGRRTVAFLTGVDAGRGVAINLCTLEPGWSADEAENRRPSDDGKVDGQPA